VRKHLKSEFFAPIYGCPHLKNPLLVRKIFAWTNPILLTAESFTDSPLALWSLCSIFLAKFKVYSGEKGVSLEEKKDIQVKSSLFTMKRSGKI